MNRGGLIVITVQPEPYIGAGYASHYTVAGRPSSRVTVELRDNHISLDFSLELRLLLIKSVLVHLANIACRGFSHWSNPEQRSGISFNFLILKLQATNKK